jgi:hypothetical protein
MTLFSIEAVLLTYPENTNAHLLIRSEFSQAIFLGRLLLRNDIEIVK